MNKIKELFLLLKSRYIWRKCERCSIGCQGVVDRILKTDTILDAERKRALIAEQRVAELEKLPCVMSSVEWASALTKFSGYCFERHAAMGIELRQAAPDLWCVLDNGEAIIVFWLSDAKLVEQLFASMKPLLQR